MDRRSARGEQRGGHVWRAALALTLAYALSVQLLLAGAAAALATAPGDMFRTSLCRPSGAPAGDSVPAGHGYPACCVLGCAFGAPLAPPPEAGLHAPARTALLLKQQAFKAAPAPHEEQRAAHRARAPPPTPLS